MKKYNEIELKEYYFKPKDLLLVASTQPDLIKKVIETAYCSLITFNWKGKQENTEINSIRYIDDKIEVDIAYIEEKSKELFLENRYVVILINDFDSGMKYDKKLGKRLKKLAKELNTIIIVETKVKDNLERLPLLKDIENQELVKSADVVFFREIGEIEIIAKNKYGKIGIVKKQEM